MSTCHNTSEKSSTTKVNKHTSSGYSLLAHCSFDATKKKIKNFCLDLREHVTKIVNYEKKEIILLTKKEDKVHNNKKVCHICKKRFSTGDNNGALLNKKYHKVRIIVIILENTEVLP